MEINLGWKEKWEMKLRVVKLGVSKNTINPWHKMD
jgi:hypothetical protein